MGRKAMEFKFQVVEIRFEMAYTHPIAFLEGNLEINMGEVFFLEPGILLIELGLCIKKWLNSSNKGVFQNFVYNSIEHDESIFSLIAINAQQYEIISEWAKNIEKHFIEKDDVIKCFNAFLIELNACINFINTEHNLTVKIDKLFI